MKPSRWAKFGTPLLINAAALAVVGGMTLVPFAASMAQPIGSAASAVSVPEPMSLALLATGVAGVCFARRRRRHTRKRES